MSRRSLIFGALLALSPSLGMTGGTPSQTYLNPQCLTSVWAPTSSKVANADRWQEKSSFDRLELATNAPTADGDAVVTVARAGVPGSMSMYKQGLDAARAQKPSIARVQVSLYIPDNGGFNKSNAKMPLGLWGGLPEGPFCGMGLCAPQDQTGFSVRLTRTRLNSRDETAPFEHGPRIYSYHINREGTPQKTTNSDGSVKYKLQGEGINLRAPLKGGQWYRVVMDVGLNSFQDGQPVADGWTDMYLMDANGRIIGHAGKTGLIYRKSPDWHVMGPMLTDLWGGDETKPTNLPLKDTVTYYEDYEMFLLTPGKSPEQCLDRARLSAAGSGAPVQAAANRQTRDLCESSASGQARSDCRQSAKERRVSAREERKARREERRKQKR